MSRFLTSLRFFFLNFCPGYHQIKSIARWCDTGQAIDDWTDANTIPISCSETGRTLVREHIEAHLEVLRRHRFIKVDIDYIQMWCRHLQPSL